MRLHLFAPSTIFAALLALTSYSPAIDAYVAGLFHHDQSMASVEPQTDQLPTAGAHFHSITDPEELPSGASSLGQATNSNTEVMNDNPDDAETTPAANPQIERKLVVKRGDSLGEIVARAGLTDDEQARVTAALTRFMDPSSLKPGQVFTLTLQKDQAVAHLVSLEVTPDAQRLISITAKQGGGFDAREISSRVSLATRAVAGTINDSLYDSAIRAKLPLPILSAFIRAYSYDIDFQRDIQPGDKFQILYQVVVNDRNQIVRPGNILAASLNLGGKDDRMYLHQSADGTLEFFSADGKSIRKTLLRTPVDGARITSGFGMRMHPLLGYTKMHKGVDFGVPSGTPVFAAGDGIIEKMGWWGGYGKYLRLRHNSETGTAYAHLSRFSPGLQEGSRVRQGQIVAFTGTTGSSTGPHLHYEVLRDGMQVNPLTMTASLGNQLQGRDLALFRKLAEDRDRTIMELINPVAVANRGNAVAAKLD